MAKFTIIGGTQVKAGDYVQFKREVPEPVAAGHPLKSSVITLMYEGTVSEIREGEICLRTDHFQWVLTQGAEMIEHRARREVGWWEIQVAHGKPAHPYYWNGTSWLNSTDQNHLSYLGTEFHKENYLGPSALA